MTAILILLLAQHAVVSARAGLVTYTEGWVNVAVDDLVGEGNSLTTGPSGRAEITLNPDSYLRILPYTGVVIESEEVGEIRFRLTGGSALAEIHSLDGDFPIRVGLEGLEVVIPKAGTYLFEPDRVVVLDGELQLPDPDSRIRKGRSLVRTGDTFSEVETPDGIEDHALVEWNETRNRDLVPRRPRRLLTPRF
jgi:hypothetical protein